MLKMNPIYLKEFFGESIGPPKGNRSREEELNKPCNLEK